MLIKLLSYSHHLCLSMFCCLQHLLDALTQPSAIEEAEGAKRPHGEDLLRGRRTILNDLVGTVMTEVTRYGSLEAEGAQDNMGIAGHPVPVGPLVPESAYPEQYAREWDRARAAELLSSPAGKAARMELCGVATEPWRLECKDLRAWVAHSLAGEQPAASVAQAVKNFLEGATGGHNQSLVTALAERVQVERHRESLLSSHMHSEVDNITWEYASVARASIRTGRCESAGAWLSALLSILNRVQPVDARGMFCQRLAIP